MSKNSITFDELKVGDLAVMTKTISEEDIKRFAETSGDYNPIHLDQKIAKQRGFDNIVAHGIWSGVFLSSVIGVKLPGPGSILIQQSFQYKRPVLIGDTIQAIVTVRSKNSKNKTAMLDLMCVNQNDTVVTSGQAQVVVPVA